MGIVGVVITMSIFLGVRATSTSVSTLNGVFSNKCTITTPTIRCHSVEGVGVLSVVSGVVGSDLFSSSMLLLQKFDFAVFGIARDEIREGVNDHSEAQGVEVNGIPLGATGSHVLPVVGTSHRTK